MRMNAKQYTGNNYEEIIEWLIPLKVMKSHRLDRNFMVLYTNDEAIIVNNSDYIIIDDGYIDVLSEYVFLTERNDD
jgi:hypothetical protein